MSLINNAHLYCKRESLGKTPIIHIEAFLAKVMLFIVKDSKIKAILSKKGFVGNK